MRWSIIILCVLFISCSFNKIKLDLDLTELYQLDEILEQNQGKQNLIILSNPECSICIPFKKGVKSFVDSLIKVNNDHINIAISSINTSQNGFGSFYINQLIRQVSYPMILFFDGEQNFIGILSSGRIEDFKNVLLELTTSNNDFKIWRTDKKNMFNNLNITNDEKIAYIDNLFKLQRNLAKPLRDSSSLKDILNRNEIDYFYKNYLLAAYYFNTGDSTQSRKYADKGLDIKMNHLDSILYQPLHGDMLKFRKHKSAIKNQFCFGLDGCLFNFGSYQRGSNEPIKIELYNYFDDILSVEQINVSCSCYTINMPKLKIAPNSNAILYLTITDENKDLFDEQITIKSTYGLHKFNVKGILVNK